MAEYTLPDLPYDYGALEPHISGKIMELHHDKHHNTYVTGLNAAIDALAEAREPDTIGTTALLWEKNLAFNYGGHINHSVFWQNLSPDGGDKPTGDLGSAIVLEPSVSRVCVCRSPLMSPDETSTGSAPRRASSISPAPSRSSGGIQGSPSAA